MQRTLCLVLAALGAAATLRGARASEPIHVTYLWHIHQPIYYPCESVLDTDRNGVPDEKGGYYRVETR